MSAPDRGRTPARPELRWSLFTVGDNLAGARRRNDRPSEILSYVEEADRLGFWAFFFAEHHFHPHGEVADPWLLTAAAAERTRNGRIRLGPMVSNLAFRHPVQVAEQALYVNALSEGRVEVGLGSGNIPREHVAFGLFPDPIPRKRAAFDAAVPSFLAVASGRRWAVPELAGGEVRVEIGAPIEPPGRIWFAVGNPEAAIRFASKGHSVALGPPFAVMPDLAALADQVSRIRAGLPASVTPRIAAAFPAYAGPRPARAVEALDAFLAQRDEDARGHLAPGAPSPGSGRSAADLVGRDLALIGSPEEVDVQVRRVAATGVTDLFAIPDFGALEPELVTASIRSLAKLGGLNASGTRSRRRGRSAST